MSFLGALGALGGIVAAPFTGGSSLALTAGALGYMGQQDANDTNQDIASAQMAFQADQSGTAYQRATADMKAAGLNPMLAYSKGGASTPNGASIPVQNELGAGVSSAQQSIAMATGASQVDLNRALSTKAAADSLVSINSARQIDAGLPKKELIGEAYSSASDVIHHVLKSAKDLLSDGGGEDYLSQLQRHQQSSAQDGPDLSVSPPPEVASDSDALFNPWRYNANHPWRRH